MKKELMPIDTANRAVAEAGTIPEISKVQREISSVIPILTQLVREGLKSFDQLFPLLVAKLRAERKGGTMLAEIERQPGGIGRYGSSTIDEPLYSQVLEEAGLHFQTAQNWQLEALVSEEIFNQLIQGARARQDVITSHELMLIGKRQLVLDTPPPPPLPLGIFNVIYADPPWKYTFQQHSQEAQDTTLDTHFKTLTIEELCTSEAEKVKPHIAGDAVLFLWATSPFLEDSFQVVKAWGFEYKTSMIWDKIKHNVGYYVSVRHEILLICTKGSMLPEVKTLYDSVQSIERSSRHSRKPEEFYDIIEALYPSGSYLELYATQKRSKRWEAWGNEVAPSY